MKKLIITCALLSATSLASFAQNQTTTTMSMQAPQDAKSQAPGMAPANPRMPPVEMMADRRSKMYEKQLSLTADQTKSIYQAELAFWKEDFSSRANGAQPGPGQTAQNQMGKDMKFKQILTPEQYAKYEATRPNPNPMQKPAAK